jgi:hypothetical protein
MGAIKPSKMPSGVKKSRRDDTDFTEYAKGGLTPSAPSAPKSAGSLAGEYSTLRDVDLAPAKKRAQSLRDVQALRNIESEEALRSRLKGFSKGGAAKSKVNEAGNYTKPGMRKALFNSIKSQAVQGTAAGQWSARKAQLLAKKYKEKGGGYRD